MTDAFKIDEERETGWFDLTRLPAAREVILPPEVKRRALIAALVGVFGLVIAAALFWFVDDLDKVKIVLKWQENTLFGVAYISAIIGAIALLRIYTELAGWDRRRLVTLGEGYVEITRWPIIGARKFNHVPLADYTGVMKNFEDYGKYGARYTIGLMHDNLRLGELLYSSRSAGEWDEKWRHYAGILRLPAIDEGHRQKDAKIDGTPAIKVLPGAVFTLDVDDLPAAALFDVPPGSRLVSLVVGILTLGLFGGLSWEAWAVSADMDLALVLLLVALLVGGIFLSIAVRSHLAYRTVFIDRIHVTGARRRLLGMERWVEPISAFRGVRGSARKGGVFGDVERSLRYAITLVHPEGHRSAILYRAAYEDDLVSKLQYYADRLGVPILDEEPG